MNHDEYLKRRDSLEKIREDSFDSFDKTILTLSTGAIALSITFLDKIGKPCNTITLVMIFTAWFLLLAVIISNLLSFFFAVLNMDKKINDLDNNYKKQNEQGINIDSLPEKFFWQYKAVKICNKIALICFIVGSILLISYVSTVQFSKYNKEISMNSKDRNDYGKVEAPKPLQKGKVETTRPLSEGKTESPKPVEKPKQPDK